MNSYRNDSPAAHCRTGKSHTTHLTASSRRHASHPRRSTSSPFKIWAIESPEARARIAETTNYTFGAGVFLVVGGNREEAWVRQYDERNFADVDASIVATYIMLAIHNEGLRSTWVGHFDAEKLKGFFPQMADYDLIAIFPIGYATKRASPPRATRSAKLL